MNEGNGATNIAAEIAKQAAKKKLLSIILASSSAIIPLFFALFVVLLVVVIIPFDGSANESNSDVVYESECNYEGTKVTVMDGSNTKVLATVSLEDYILGVVCPEIGACSGNVSSMEEHYLKTKFIATRTYTLARGKYNYQDKSITIKASTRDQQWCDLESGCIVTKTNDLIPGYTDQYYYNTYPGDYNEANVNGVITQRYSYTEEDLKLLHQYYDETYGELYLSDEYNDIITTLNSKAATEYKAKTQRFWKSLAEDGLTYEEILYETGISDVPDHEDYYGKSIYKLRNYCKVIYNGSSGLPEAEGEVVYNTGGMPIPVYYQQDYSDVILKNEKTVASSGCGFTASSMIVSYLLDKKITPREFVDDWSRAYYVYNEGMSHALPNAAAQHYNLGNVITTTSAKDMVEALRNGQPVMSSQGPGMFTGGGHIIVLRGITNDGMILVNDPNKHNAVNRQYNIRKFLVSEIEAARGKYFIWPKKA